MIEFLFEVTRYLEDSKLIRSITDLRLLVYLGSVVNPCRSHSYAWTIVPELLFTALSPDLIVMNLPNCLAILLSVHFNTYIPASLEYWILFVCSSLYYSNSNSKAVIIPSLLSYWLLFIIHLRYWIFLSSIYIIVYISYRIISRIVYSYSMCYWFYSSNRITQVGMLEYESGTHPLRIRFFQFVLCDHKFLIA